MAKEEGQEADLGDYTDYLLLSSSDFTAGWRHNIMRLAPASSTDTTDVRHWSEAKLNRRDMQRVQREEAEIAKRAADSAREAEEAAARGEALNGGMDVELKPGMPGYMAAQMKRDEEARDDSKVAPAPAAAGGLKSTRNPRRGFGAPKKTRRVYITDDSSKERRRRFEERHPWVLETEDDKKPPNETRWVGKMDSSTSAGAGEGSSYVCLVLDPHSAGSEAAFKVVPANRWYKFASRPKYHTLTAEEAEEEFEKMQKASDLDTWFSSRRMNTGAAGPSAAGRSTRGPDSFMAAGTAQPAGGYGDRLARARGDDDGQQSHSRLRTVYGQRAGSEDLFGDREAAGPAGRRAGKSSVRPRRRAEADGDEREDFEYEEDFQDDEEGIGMVGDDALDAEENRELEERMKREMRELNDSGNGVEDADEDDGLASQLTKAGRRMKKILKNRGRRGRPEDEEDDMDDLDDDDDDDDLRNPYASEKEEDSDSDAEKEVARRKQAEISGKFSATQPPPMSRNVSGNSGPKYPGASAGPSRSASSGPSGSRATSPTPTSGVGARAACPTGSRPGSRVASPTPPPSATKRKADEGNSPAEVNGVPGTTKRRKPGSPSPAPAVTPVAPVAPGDDSALISREEIIAFIRDRSPSTKELLKHFKTAMNRDPRNKEVILSVTREVAAIADGRLSLKKAPGSV